METRMKNEFSGIEKRLDELSERTLHTKRTVSWPLDPSYLIQGVCLLSGL